jgi:hypothetical protein
MAICETGKEIIDLKGLLKELDVYTKISPILLFFLANRSITSTLPPYNPKQLRSSFITVLEAIPLATYLVL